MKRTVVISLGGSLIVPEAGKVDLAFLKKFRKVVLDFLRNKNNRVIIVTGGGKLNRRYNESVRQLIKPKPIDLDWLGIAATRFHAEFIRILFGSLAYSEIVWNPTKKVKTNKQVLCAGGWQPGCSTDKDAVLLARTYQSQEVINLTNIDYVYTKDPRKFKNAKKVSETTWAEYFKMIPKKWSPRLNTPFDPVASRLAKRYKMSVYIVNGAKTERFRRILAKEGFRGTLIKPKI